ncbi:hypothetical protein NEOLI_000403 [Neolecta irregularis DAH-3]|uniref:Uncharacterized protein n=1 Tax=Neolecta irregularis (strain DAH-3) TaxID=1198029 RepID=A0A1U7LUH4_NEOID|nr:hypothetical protein NEOLI_000403 [Neolecta irregularis DAH-3]|eukprot:OLL26326.1 hypothetical protein NEOLI_000403 [Neolecta irregularis DAH-3]
MILISSSIAPFLVLLTTMLILLFTVYAKLYVASLIVDNMAPEAVREARTNNLSDSTLKIHQALTEISPKYQEGVFENVQAAVRYYEMQDKVVIDKLFRLGRRQDNSTMGRHQDNQEKKSPSQNIGSFPTIEPSVRLNDDKVSSAGRHEGGQDNKTSNENNDNPAITEPSAPTNDDNNGDTAAPQSQVITKTVTVPDLQHPHRTITKVVVVTATPEAGSSKGISKDNPTLQSTASLSVSLRRPLFLSLTLISGLIMGL